MDTHNNLTAQFVKYRKYWICFFLYWIILMPLIILLASGRVSIICEGIRVDQSGNIYVGVTEEIRVFDADGNFLRRISAKTSKGYVFDVQGDRLYLDAASASYIMDLNGAVLAQVQYPQLPYTMKTPKTVQTDEAVYHITCSTFFYRVAAERGGEKTVVVRMPASDLAAEIVFFAVILAFVITMILFFRASGAFPKRVKPGSER